MDIINRLLESEALNTLAMLLQMEAAYQANEFFYVRTEYTIPSDGRARGYRWPLNPEDPFDEKPDLPGTRYYYHARVNLWHRKSWEKDGRKRREQAFALSCYIDGCTGHGYLERHCYLELTLDAALARLKSLGLPDDTRWLVKSDGELDHALVWRDGGPLWNSDTFSQNIAYQFK